MNARPMRVVVFASQKGGSGKTTICGHMAVEASRTGFGPVAIMDTDPQGSLGQWAASRHSRDPAYIDCDITTLRSALVQAQADGFKLVCVDTPPSLTRAISNVISFADLVVVPTRPSPHDVRAVGATIDLVDWHQKPMMFVINGATPRARITSDSAVALSQHGTVAPSFLHHRVDFAASMIDGRTVMEANPDSKSATEMRELWGYIGDKLTRMEEVLNGVPNPHELSRTTTRLSPMGGAPLSFGRRTNGAAPATAMASNQVRHGA